MHKTGRLMVMNLYLESARMEVRLVVLHGGSELPVVSRRLRLSIMTRGPPQRRTEAYWSGAGAKRAHQIPQVQAASGQRMSPTSGPPIGYDTSRSWVTSGTSSDRNYSLGKWLMRTGLYARSLANSRRSPEGSRNAAATPSASATADNTNMM